MVNVIDIATEDDVPYQFFPVASGSIQFKVRSANDAHIALIMGPQVSDPIVEVFIGGWVNMKSVIRRNRTKPNKVEIETPGILNAGEFRGFWVRWDGGVISVGREGEAIPFMSWSDPEPFPIRFVGVCTRWGATGSWKIEVAPSAPSVAALYSTPPGYPSGPAGSAAVWVDACNGQVPPGAVVGGHDCSGEPLYIARAHHEDALIPGKLVASRGRACVPRAVGEHSKRHYQVLVGDMNNWVPVTGAKIPLGAFHGGEAYDGEPLFIGRVHHEGSITTGKVQECIGVCYIPFNGLEIGFLDYEILMP